MTLFPFAIFLFQAVTSAELQVQELQASVRSLQAELQAERQRADSLKLESARLVKPTAGSEEVQDQLRRERDQLAQSLRQADEEIKQLRRSHEQVAGSLKAAQAEAESLRAQGSHSMKTAQQLLALSDAGQDSAKMRDDYNKALARAEVSGA